MWAERKGGELCHALTEMMSACGCWRRNPFTRSIRKSCSELFDQHSWPSAATASQSDLEKPGREPGREPLHLQTADSLSP